MSTSLLSDLNQYSPTTTSLLTDEAAIIGELNNILATRRYDRLFNNNFGIDFEDELFEIIDDITSLEILRIITERVELFLPTITINYSTTQVLPDPDNNQYTVTLVFSINGQEDQGDIEFQGVVKAA